jgi:hypothetical protein
MGSIANKLFDFLTSLFLVTIIMLAILIGIAQHMINVFDSVFLGVGYQSIVLLTSVNSHLLPKIKTGSKESIIPYIVSFITFWLLFIDWGGLEHFIFSKAELIIFTKSIVVAFMEFIFSFLFTNRNNERLKNHNKEDSNSIDIPMQELRCYKIKEEILNLKKSNTRGLKWTENETTLSRIIELSEEYNNIVASYLPHRSSIDVPIENQSK